MIKLPFKRIGLGLALILLGTASARATSVTATVTDAASQSWNNGTWSATLVTKSGFYPPSTGYVIASTQFPVPNANGVSGALDSSGAFSTTLTDVKTIAPAGATWRIQVCPLASSGCFVAQVDVTGVSENISAQLAPPAATVNLSIPAAYYLAYSDSEIINGNLGQTYTNLITSDFKVCLTIPCGWVALGKLSGMGAAGQIAVWSAPTVIGGSPAFTQDPTDKGVTVTESSDNEDTGVIQAKNSTAPVDSALQMHVNDTGTPFIIGHTPDTGSGIQEADIDFNLDGNIALRGALASGIQLIIDGTDNNVTMGVGSYLMFPGTTGSAGIGVAAAAGTPCTLLLPTISPSAGQFLQSAAPSGAPATCQGSWATPTFTNPLSGMTATQVAIAGSSNTITSSKALQGTDTNVLTSGTISGVGAALCTDANNGATTSGCGGGTGSITAVDAVTQSAAITTSTLLVCPASPVAGTNYLLSWNAHTTTAATNSSTLGPLQLTYTMPDNTTITTESLAYVLAPTGTTIDRTGGAGNITTTYQAGVPFLVNCKASSTISYAYGYASTGVTAMVYDLHIRAQQQ